MGVYLGLGRGSSIPSCLVNTPAPAVRCAFMRRQFSAGGVSGGFSRPRRCTGRGVVVVFAGVAVSFDRSVCAWSPTCRAFNAVLCAVPGLLLCLDAVRESSISPFAPPPPHPVAVWSAAS